MDDYTFQEEVPRRKFPWINSFSMIPLHDSPEFATDIQIPVISVSVPYRIKAISHYTLNKVLQVQDLIMLLWKKNCHVNWLPLYIQETWFPATTCTTTARRTSVIFLLMEVINIFGVDWRKFDGLYKDFILISNEFFLHLMSHSPSLEILVEIFGT